MALVSMEIIDRTEIVWNPTFFTIQVTRLHEAEIESFLTEWVLLFLILTRSRNSSPFLKPDSLFGLPWPQVTATETYPDLELYKHKSARALTNRPILY